MFNMLDEKDSPDIIRKNKNHMVDKIDGDKKEIRKNKDNSILEKRPTKRVDNKIEKREEFKSQSVIDNKKAPCTEPNNKDLISPQLTSAAARARELKMNWLNKQNSMKNDNNTQGTFY